MIRYFLFLAVAASSLAADWPQFRGPGGSGVSGETGLPVKWTATDNVRWKADLPGRGISSPAVAGGRVYVTACSGYRMTHLHVLCFDAATGTRLWERQFTATGPTMCHPTTTLAGPSPAADGKAAYALFGTGDLAALDRDGNLLWYRSLGRDYGGIANQLGLAASPVLAGDTLLLPMENTDRSFAAGLDTKTGRNKWKVERKRGTNCVTPVALPVAGRLEAVFATPGEMTAYDPETGAAIWTHTGISPSSTASPGSAEGGLLVVPGRELCLVRPGPGETTPEVVWQTGKTAHGDPSPVAYRGRVYVLAGVGVDCVDGRTGRSLWKQRVKGGQFWASPLAADGKLYAVAEDGLCTVIRLGDQPEVLATNPLGESVFATPAIADGCLYLRTERHLFCIGGRK